MRLEMVAADGGVGRVALPVEIDFRIVARNCDRLHLVELFVRSSAIDGFPVDVEPFSEVKQTFLLQERNFTVSSRTHVESHTYACCHKDAEMADEFVGSHVVFQRLVAVEAKRTAQAATLGPRSVGEGDACAVFGRSEAVLLPFAPAVVDNGVFAYGVVVPRDEFGGVPLFRAVAPFTVGEEYSGLVARDKFLELRNHVRINVCANLIIWVNIPAMDVTFPLGKGVVKSHFETYFADGFGQIAADVALWSDLNRIPAWRILAWPKAETVVVFRDQKHILCS